MIYHNTREFWENHAHGKELSFILKVNQLAPLKKFTIYHSEAVVAVLPSLSSLEILECFGTRTLLPRLHFLTNLRKLSFFGRDLLDTERIYEPPQLRSLCMIEGDPICPSLERLQNLTKLEIYPNETDPELVSLVDDGIYKLTNLEKLAYGGWLDCIRLAGHTKLRSLTSHSLEELPYLPELTKLDVWSVRSTDIEFQPQTNLTSLRVRNTMITGTLFQYLTNLTYLSLADLYSNGRFNPRFMSCLTNLKTLVLKGCRSKGSYPFHALTSLTELQIEETTKIRTEHLTCLTNLKTLKVRGFVLQVTEEIKQFLPNLNFTTIPSYSYF